MSISLNEWMAAKELLVLLAQALSGKSDGIGAPLGFSGTALIAQRVFSKPFGFSSERFPHAVRLLPTLQIAKKQIERWIETLPADSSRPDQNFLPTGKPGNQHPQNGNLLDAKQGMQGSLAKTLAQGAEPERLASKAHKLVEEVRIAIQTLSTSSFLGDPRPAPLRAALAKLKPLVDEFIEAISKHSLDPQQNGSFSPFKHQPRFRTEPKRGKFSSLPLFHRTASVPRFQRCFRPSDTTYERAKQGIASSKQKYKERLSRRIEKNRFCSESGATSRRISGK